jgi:hypothetical protein
MNMTQKILRMGAIADIDKTLQHYLKNDYRRMAIFAMVWP